MNPPNIETEHTSNNQVQKIGILIVGAAVLWQGFGTAVMGHTIRPEQSVMTTAIAFFIAALFGIIGWALNSRKRKHSKNYGALLKSVGMRRLLLLNAVTAGAFGLFYVAATLIPPTGGSVLEVGIGPIAILLLVKLIAKSRISGWKHPVVVLTLAALTAWGALAGSPGSSFQQLTGITLSIAAGLCAAGVLLISQSLTRDGITVWEISALRFHLLWGLAICLAVPFMREAELSPNDVTKILIVAIFCITGPILLLQWGITLAQMIHSAMLIACLPAAVLVADLAHGSHFPTYVIAGVFAIVAVSLWSTIKKEKNS